ncbi:MerR family transcriptional regulator [Bacillus massiliigorillae]|uniref:MerR family transcriptional regulator n=1 Tax=Bacillus massiliigorillae TaxID=1243664 RepID=UPI00039CEBAA|nr:MerR family transcriptional regulator [Bacillus massiliigorillae]
MRIGELAQLSNVSKRTIDYYTNIGLIEAERTASNYRCYTQEAYQKLKIIKELKNKNMSLDEIREFFLEQDTHNLDLNKLKQKLEGLEKDVSEIVELIQKNKLDKTDLVNKQISHETITLIQTLLILLL